MDTHFDNDHTLRSPIVDSATGEITYLKEMRKGVERGTYHCAECYKITGDLQKSAVYLKGGTAKVCRHASHYPNSACKGGATAMHRYISEAIAYVTGGDLEGLYLNSNFKSDVAVGSTYWEVIHTSWMSDKKRDFVKPHVLSGRIQIKCVNVENIPREMREEMWDVWFKHDRGQLKGWQNHWFKLFNMEPFTKNYKPRDIDSRQRSSTFEPVGDNCVGHYSNSGCNQACTYARKNDDGSDETSTLVCCTMSYLGYVPAGANCEYGLGKTITH